MRALLDYITAVITNSIKSGLFHQTNDLSECSLLNTSRMKTTDFADHAEIQTRSFFFLMQKFLWLQLRDHPSKRQTDEPNAHELLLLVTAKNRGSRCEEAFSSESGQSMLEKDIFEMQIARS